MNGAWFSRPKQATVLWVTMLLAPATLVAQTQIILCGGGSEPTTAMKEFVSRAGGAQANILFVGFAASFPEETANSFKETIESYLPGANAVTLSPFLKPAYDSKGERILNDENDVQFVEELSENEQSSFITQIKLASAIWLSGGMQDRFMRIMERYPKIKKELQDFFASGKLIGGSSAGAAVAAEVMVIGHKITKKFWQSPGMGFLAAVVDQHLFARDRVERLRSSVKEYRSKVRYGVGIDEDAAILVTGGTHLTVIEGGNDVLIIDPRDTTSGTMKEIRLKGGAYFDLVN